MPKYEIMIIADPIKNVEEIKDFFKNIFGSDIKKFEKLERTELAYEINNTKTASYYLIEVVTEPSNIKEFTRKTNICKFIWRELIINLDSEKSMDTMKYIRTEEQVAKLKEELSAKWKAISEAKKQKKVINE